MPLASKKNSLPRQQKRNLNRPYSYSRTGLGRVFCFARKRGSCGGKLKIPFDTAGKIRRKSLWFAVFDGKIMVKHNCCAYGCSNSTEKQKNHLKYPELKGITFHTFPIGDRKKTYAPGMNENERRKRWIAACRLSSLNVTRHTRICSAHFEGGLGPSKLNPVPTIFSFPTHLQPKTRRKRTDPEERRRGALSCIQNKTKTAPRRQAGKTDKNKENPEPLGLSSQLQETACSSDMDFIFSEECEIKTEQTPDPRSLADKCIQTDLTCEDIDCMEAAKAKLENKPELKREMFIDDVLKSNKSVCFYTGLPSYACLMMLFPFLKPFANAMKYWDNKKKGQRETYQVS